MFEVIKTTKRGKHLIILDAVGMDLYNKYTWTIQRIGKKQTRFYLARYKAKNKYVYFHRELLELKDKKLQVDHVNHNGLDNRLDNLRVVTNQQNSFNTTKTLAKKTSIYKGVSFFKPKGKFRARIVLNGKEKHLGYFDSEEKAAIAYNQAATQLFKNYAVLNEVYGVTVEEDKYVRREAGESATS